MENYFIIPIIKIDPFWSIRRFGHNRYALEYCKNVLHIPTKYIEDARFSHNEIEINLIDLEHHTQEAWYIHLINLSKSASIP